MPNAVTKSKKVRKLVIGIILFFIFFFLLYFGFRFWFFRNTTSDLKMVSGTEYISGEFGQVIIRLTDRFGNEIIDATCSATILYPDKTYFLLDASMGLSTTGGNYYREFTTPSVTGIYEEIITCTFDKNGPRTEKISSSFHVSPALNFVVELSQREREHYDELVRRLNETYVELMHLFNESNANFKNINETMQEEMNRVVGASKEEMYGDFADLGRAYVDIFGNE
jgi:hypothetical protein